MKPEEFKKKWQPDEGHLNMSRNLFNTELDELIENVCKEQRHKCAHEASIEWTKKERDYEDTRGIMTIVFNIPLLTDEK